jgi:hypothetical protein
MRKCLLTSSFLLFVFSAVYSQSDRFAYVITDVNKEGFNWSTLRRIDLQSNAFSDVLLNGSDISQTAYDAVSKKPLTQPLKDERFGTLANAAFGTGVAAIALDKKNNRLYYTPMFIDQLRYIDLKTMKTYFVGNAGVEALKVKANDQSNIITRMAFASDGNGYALTNDGNHLLQFSTGKKSHIVDLGAVVDDPNNKGVSVHNSCTSFGGDMIADDDDNLYVFSARNHVFRINLETKVATHMGAINGLPANYTINGAAVNENNQIVVVSAVQNNALYTIDHKTWTATAVNSSATWRSSDLANSNLLGTKKFVPVPELISAVNEAEDTRISMFPNPARGKQFTIQFNEPAGSYTVLVSDVAGRQAVKSVANIQGKGQTQLIQLPADTKSGVYLVKVVDQNSQTIFSKKLLVQ